MTEVTLVTVSAPAARQTVSYAREHRADDLRFNIFYFSGERDNGRIDPSKMEAAVMRSDLCIVDMMATDQDSYSMVCDILVRYRGQRIIVGRPGPLTQKLGGYDEKRFRAKAEDVAAVDSFIEYYMSCESGDMESAYNMLLKRYFGHDSLPDPLPVNRVSGLSIRDPVTHRSYDSLGDYRNDFPVRHGETVAVYYNALNYPYDSSAVVGDMVSRLGGFADVIPIGLNGYDPVDIGRLKELVGDDVAINIALTPFRFIAGPMGGSSTEAMEFLRDTDAPFLRPFFMSRGNRADWERSQAGLGVPEFMIFVFFPELDGGVCTIPLGTAECTEVADEFNLAISEVVPIDDRMERLCGKVRGLLRLRELSNSDKRIALIGYNYPPGEGNVFGGSFLDTFASMENILNALKDAGYDIGDLPTDDLKHEFLDNGILNDGDWIVPDSSNMAAFRGKEHHPWQVTDYWGPAPGDILVCPDGYMIPGVTHGNVFVGIQPPVSLDTGDDLAEMYHDVSVPPHHQYLAFYEWLRTEFKADAIVHVGTHGTAEFLPGKDAAMSGQCFPDTILGDIPHFYMYYAGNPSEAVVAKRRTHAAIVSYMAPPYVHSDLYGDLSELEGLISEYRESRLVDRGRSENVLADILRRAGEMRLPTDIDALEHELEDIRLSLIPKGLHRIGEALSPEDAEEFAVQAMRFPHDTCRALETILSERGEEEPARTAEAMYRQYIHGTVPEGCSGDGEVMASLEYGKQIYLDAQECMEIDGLLKSLDCRFVEAKLGGDLLRNPDILPTGYNMVQFNPKAVPSMSAFERGREAAENTIAMYLEEHGEYPRSVALVMWGLEVSRSQGATVGQILTYLGLRMVDTGGPFEERFEVIPAEELGRPRIDVTVTICGFFRDMFANLVTGLNRIFAEVSELDEPEETNYFAAGTRRNYDKLIADGYSEEDARDLSVCRLFGPDEGLYGTAMTEAVSESTWKDEGDLADMFESGLRFAYSQKHRGLDTGDLMTVNHRSVDVVSQIRDNVDYEMVDLDHFYEFFGGLSKTVEQARGSKAAMYITDNTGPKPKTTDVRTSIEHGIRTRLLNPKWIDGLLESDYHGAQKINDRFENVLGLAATTGAVDSSVFSDMESCYIADEDLRRRLRENNNWALMGMIRRLYEARERGYWSATDEELATLEEAYFESEEMAEEESDRD